MCIDRLLEFERDWYRRALRRLEPKLNLLATEKEEERFNELWLLSYEALDREKLAIEAAELGLLTHLISE